MKMFGPPAWASTSQRSSRLSSPDPSSSSSRNLGAQLGHREHIFRHLDIVSTSLSDTFFTFHHFLSSTELPFTLYRALFFPSVQSPRGHRKGENVKNCKSRVNSKVRPEIFQAGRKAGSPKLWICLHGQNGPQVSSSKQSMCHFGCSAN